MTRDKDLPGESHVKNEIRPKKQMPRRAADVSGNAGALVYDKFAKYRINNNCVKRRNCNKLYLCGNTRICGKSCAGCDLCNELCDDYVEETCHKLYEKPHFCDTCLEAFLCVSRKEYGFHQKALDAYCEQFEEDRDNLWIPYSEPDFFYHDYDHTYGGLDIRVWGEGILESYDKSLRKYEEAWRLYEQIQTFNRK